MTEKEKSIYLLSIKSILQEAGIPFVFNASTNELAIAERHESAALIAVYLGAQKTIKNVDKLKN